MTDLSLLVVRGKTSELDPTFLSVARSQLRNHYVALDVRDGRVESRTLYRASERPLLESRLEDRKYGSVAVDKRDDTGLLPLHCPPNALAADVQTLLREKSDEELKRLRHLSTMLASGNADNKYRGVDQNADIRVTTRHATGFTQVTKTAVDDAGMTVRTTNVQPHTEE